MQIRILLVEDDRATTRLLERRLEQQGVRFNIARSANDALLMMEMEEYNLLILDYILPDMTALQLVKQIEQKFGPIPFIVTTGQGNEQIAVELMKSGALDYVVKDQNFLEFIVPIVNRAIAHVETESKLRRTELAYLESEARLRQIIDTLPNMIYVLDRKKRFIVANYAVETNYHSKIQYLIGKTLDQLNEHHPNYIQVSNDDIKQVLQDNKSLKTNYHLTDESGQVRYYQSTLIPYKTSGIRKQLFLGISTEVTALKRAESGVLDINKELEQRVIERTTELKLEHEKLIQMNKMNNDILSIVAHDLRSPLTIIVSMIDILELDYPEISAHENGYFENILKACNRMTSLISDLLDSSKLESENFELTLIEDDIVSLVQETSMEFESDLLRKNVDLNITTTNNQIPLLMNRERLWQVLSNILSNAIKFSHENGRVDVDIDDKSENQVTITIRDYGVGMSKPRLAVLFEKFTNAGRTGTRGEHSTGLGMSICKRLVELHQGIISVDTKVEQGTTISLSFPKIEMVN